MKPSLTLEERLLAAMAHAAVVVTGAGIIVGVVVYLTQQEKSPYAAGQALQAAVYQLLGMIGIMALWIVYGIFTVIALIPMIQHPALYEDAPPPLF